MADLLNVLIKENGRVQDTDTRKTISKSNGDQVRFYTLSGGPWTVVFPSSDTAGYSGSPFSANSYTVSVNNPATTSAPTEGAGVDQTYKYQVKNAAGMIKDDPDILIDL
jgi:hypothetical protein